MVLCCGVVFEEDGRMCRHPCVPGEITPKVWTTLKAIMRYMSRFAPTYVIVGFLCTCYGNLQTPHIVVNGLA